MAKLGPNSLTQVFTEIKNWVVSKLSSKANDSDVVHTTGNEIVEGTKTFSSQIKGNISGSSTSCTGNSASATKLATARTISLTGAVTGSVSFNGSANASISTTLSNIDASKITSGTIDIARIPKAALAELKIVADDDARFVLTTADIQNGDTVKVESTGKMYYVKDQTKLSTEDGYAVYTADQASSVDWSGVINKPTTFTPSSHTHGKITNDGKIGTAANKPLITTTGGVVTTGSFGTAANTFCQGNDSRLSDARTPKAHTHAKSDITDFPTLATVATSGSYTDLSNKPTIPTVNNATLTIQKNGTTVKTFTANASSNVTCNITVPTKVSDLTNDSGFIADVSGKADKATTLSGYGITDAYTKTQVDKKVSDLVNSAPETLDTLNELANALGNDPNFATTVATQIGTKANDSDVVHKSGNETINGTKLFTIAPLSANSATTNGFFIRNDAIARNEVPSQFYHSSFRVYDKNDLILGEYCVEKSTSGSSLLNMNVRTDDSNGNQFVESLYLNLANDGSTVNFHPGKNDRMSLGTSSLKWKDVYATTFNGNLVGNADTATKATNNASGNELSNNIIKGLSVSGKVITYTKLDGSTGTITTQDTNTWTAFKGATSSANGTAGYVPAPTKGNQDKFFKADGTWATPTNTTYSVATTSTNGLMSNTDKTKLDGLSNYTLPTASSTLGGVKTTSTVTSTSGLTACPIISGVVYYKDTNTDVKVTNTLNNTTKAYITGTTSATTNTGTQIFDTGVYLTTTAGQLHADIDFPITEAQVNEILGIS